MAELLGCSLDDLLSRSGYDFIQPSELASTRDRANTLRLGARLHFETELQRGDGSKFIAEVRTNPIQDRAGKYEGSVAIVTDITARKTAERDALFRAALLDAVGEGVVAANIDATIAYVNEAAARMFGWSVAETIGVSGFDIPAAAEARDKVVEMYEGVAAGKTVTADLPLVRVDGSRFVGHVTAAPVYSGGAELVGLIAVVRDMTERMELDEALRTHGLRGSAVAVLGARAIAKGTDVAGADAVLNESIEATRRLLGADRAAILEVTSDASLSVRAGSPAGDSAVVAGGSRSLAGYTTLARGVVTVEDTVTERRFDTGSLAPETRSAMAAPVYGHAGVRAVLVAERPTAGPFDRGSADFLQALANVVGAALADRS
jgi:PAS domain S-box-containing protein